MKKLSLALIALLVALLITQVCSWVGKENKRLHDEFVATVDYLKPETIERTFSGERILVQGNEDRYENDEIVEFGRSEIKEQWQYTLRLTPVSREKAISGYCVPHPDRPGCDWSYYVMTVIASKDSQKYVTAFRWQSGTGYDPEADLVQRGYTVEKKQYFIVSYHDSWNNPNYHDIISDIDEIVVPWISAVGERENTPALP